MSEPTHLGRLRRKERNLCEGRNKKQTGRGENSLRTKKLTRIRTSITSEASRKFEDLGSLESLDI